MGRKENRKKHRAPQRQTWEAPPGWAVLIDSVSAEDRRWFEDHPGEAIRRRAAVPGEFGPMDIGNVMYVVVYQVVPGFRMRFPILRPSTPGTEAIQ